MKVTTVRELDTTPAKQVLVRAEDGRHFVVSTVVAFDTGKMETLVFGADETGYIESHAQLAGGIGQKRSEAIADLEARLDSGLMDDVPDEFIDELGGFGGAVGSLLGTMMGAALGEPQSAAPNEEDLA